MKGLEVDAPSGGCVLKIRIRRSFSQLATYCGSHATDFNGNSITAALFTNMASREPMDLSKEVGFCFRQRARKIQNTGHLIISPSTPFRTKEDLQTAINIAVEVHCLQEIPWAAWYHGEAKEKHPHAHLAFSLIGWNGKAASMSHSYRKNDEAAKQIMAAFPYLGQLKLKTKAEKPWNSEKGHAAFRREDRKRKEPINGYGGDGQRHYTHTPEDFTHRGKPGKLSENRMHALSSWNMVRNGGEKSSGILPGDARERGRKPDCVRWQSNDSTELIEINQGMKNMTIDNRLTELKNQVEAVLEEATTLDEFKAGVERTTAGAVEWWQGPGATGEIAGWSLVLGSTKLKGSEISRSLSFRRVLERLEESARRRTAKRQVEVTAEAIADTSKVLAQAVPALGGGNVVSLGLAPQPRAVVRTVPSAKPGLFIVKQQGFDIPGFVASRGECLDPENDVHLWEYRRSGSEDVVFSDDGESFRIHGDALNDPLAIDLFLRSAAKKYGSSLALTIDEVPDRSTFLAMLRASADERGIEVFDARTGLPIGAGQQHKEPPPAPASEGASLDFLDVRPDPASMPEPVPSPAPAAAGVGQGEAPAAPAQAQQAQPEAEGKRAPSLIASRDDFAGRRSAAQKVLEMANGQVEKAMARPNGPRLGVLPRDPRKTSVKELRALLSEGQSFLPVREWAEATRERHRQDWAILQGSQDAHALVLGAAILRGDPLAEALRKAQEHDDFSRASLEVFRSGMAERSGTQQVLERVTGKAAVRARELKRLEDGADEASAAAVQARVAFFSQPETKDEVKRTAALADAYGAERHALGAVELLLGLLAKFIAAVARMLGQAEARDAERELERQRQSHLQDLAQGQPEAAERDRQERAQRELEAQQEEQRGSIVFDRQRGG